MACSRGINLSAVKFLFDAYPEAIYEINDERNSPLECAREYNPNNDFNVTIFEVDDYDHTTEDAILCLSAQQGLVVAFLETQHVYANTSLEAKCQHKMRRVGSLSITGYAITKFLLVPSSF